MRKGQSISLDRSERREKCSGETSSKRSGVCTRLKRRSPEFKKWPSTSIQGGVTRMKFTLLPDTTKKKPDKTYETIVFWILDIRQWRMVIHESQRTNEVSPTAALAYCLGRTSRLWHREGEPLWSLGPGRLRPLTFTGQSNRGESCTENWRSARASVKYLPEHRSCC